MVWGRECQMTTEFIHDEISMLFCSKKSYDCHDIFIIDDLCFNLTVSNLIQFLPNPTIPRGTANDGRTDVATSEEPNINAVPPPTTGKFTENRKVY